MKKVRRTLRRLSLVIYEPIDVCGNLVYHYVTIQNSTYHNITESTDKTPRSGEIQGQVF